MKNKFSIAMSLAVILAMLLTSFVLASSVSVAVVDVSAPITSVTIAPNGSGPIVINISVSGNQEGTATFEVNRDWTLSGGTFSGSNPQEFTVGPRTGQDAATTFSTTGTVTVANGQGAGTFALTVGAFDITNSNQQGAKLSDGADASYSVTVASAPVIQPQAINVTTAAPANATYGSTFAVTASGGASGNPVVITSDGACSGSGINGSATITMTSGTGTCNVYYNQAGNSSYNAAPQVTSATAAQKADALISVTGYTGVYDGAAHGATGSATGIGGADLNASLNLGASYTNVPGGTAAWLFTGDNNYNGASGSVAIVISKAPAGCSISGYSGVYDGNSHGATGSCSGIGTLDLGASFTNVSGGMANWSFTGDSNHQDDAGSVAINISKADAIIVVNGYSGVYDGDPHGATGSATGVKGEALAGLVLGDSFTNVSGGSASWTFTDITGNYNDDSGSVAIDISKADAVLNVSGYTGTYDGLAHGATGTATGVKGEDLSAGFNFGASFTNVAGGTANWTFAGGTNYKDANGAAAVVINKATLTVTADNKTIVFGQSLPGFTFSYSGFVNGETVAVVDVVPTCSVGSIPMWGSYPITCSGGSDNNYAFAYVPGTLTVQAWTLKGFYAPVDMNGVYNVVKGGSTVPLKFEVFADVEQTSTSVVNTFVQTKIACDGSLPTDEVEVVTTGGTSLRYDATGGQFIQNWQTPKLPGQCYRVTLTTDDGSFLTAFFKLK